MANSERPAQDWTLAAAPRDVVLEVVDVAEEASAPLLVHGIRPAARLVAEGDAPLGGPRIIRLGATRIALDRGLARLVTVRAASPPVGVP